MSRTRAATIALSGAAGALLLGGCSHDPTPAAVAHPALNIVVELRGHPTDKAAWRPHVRARRGSVVVYRISLFNPAAKGISNVRLTVRLARGLRLLGGRPHLPSRAFRPPGVSLGSLDPGEARSLRFRARYTRHAGASANTRVVLTTSVGRRTAVIPTRRAR